MLLSFKFKNFRSFKDETEVNLIASRITELPSHLVEIGKQNLLKILAIYGANASGKSNIHKAFEFMYDYISSSFKFGGENLQDRNKEIEMPTSPFLFDAESKTLPSMFEIIFTEHNSYDIIYKYGFEILGSEIKNEYLFKKSNKAKNYKFVFMRSDMELKFDTEINEWKKILKFH